MDSMNLIIQSAQIMADTPFIDWDTLLKKLGDAMNVPELGELIDREMLMEMVQQQQEQEAAMAQAKMMAGRARGNQQQSRQAPQQGPQNDPLADRIRDLAGKRK